MNMSFRLLFFLVVCIFNVSLYCNTPKVSCDSLIVREPEYDSYGRRGNWDAIQPGFFSIIEKIIQFISQTRQ